MNDLLEKDVIELSEIARKLRIETLRMIHRRQAGHPGGSLSSAEIIAVLYFNIMRVDPQNPTWEDRDRFLLSKGHASAILYVALAMRGFFPMADLTGWGQLDNHLQGHPDRLKTPGVDMDSGILGHGIAIGAGMALAARQKAQKHRIYTLLGDGECQGGIVWEGASTAAKFQLANLTAILDYNDVQLDGMVHQIMPMASLPGKWKEFGWHVVEIDGHSIRQLHQALLLANEIHHQPTIIIAHTTKGKGVSYMENESSWHGRAPNDAELAQAIEELEGN